MSFSGRKSSLELVLVKEPGLSVWLGLYDDMQILKDFSQLGGSAVRGAHALPSPHGVTD